MKKEKPSLELNNSRMIRKIKIRGIPIVVLALIVAYRLPTDTLMFNTELKFTDVPALLGYLLLLALFVERCIEFILTLWRSRKADIMDRQIEKLKSELSQIPIDGTSKAKINKRSSLNEELEKVRVERIEYRATSRYAALWTGFVIGVIMALSGVRVLGHIFDYSELADYQEHIFILTDILFTGFVLAGGSDAIHKIMKVYNSFTAKIETRNRGADVA